LFLHTYVNNTGDRLVSYEKQSVTFKWKDYRANGRKRYTTMRLTTDEFIRRFLTHTLPSGFHRIRHYGTGAFLSSGLKPIE